MGDLEAGLLEWAGRQAAWQQDLLRRLAGGEVLSASDYRTYADEARRIEFAKTAPWFTISGAAIAMTAAALTAAHLTASAAGDDPVQVAKITHLQGANDLAPGAELLFELGGLTVIAGKNGSGKSGYTRIMKQLAATRASEQVLPNAFSPAVVPKAVVSYQVGANPPAIDLTWESGTASAESPLQRVRVFDARSALVQLAGATEIAYIPPTLQVLGEYTHVLHEVAQLLESDAQLERLQNREWPALEAGIGQEIFEHLGEADGLAALSCVNPLTEEETIELAAIPVKLRDLTSTNPAALASQARQRAGQLRSLARGLETVATKLTAENIKASVRMTQDVAAAQLDVDAARLVFDDADTLPDTGNEAWRQMWLAAKNFADGDDHDHDFPENFASCPLCAQLLDAAARTRLELFAHFMSSEAQTKLTTARALRSADRDALNALPLDSLVSQELVDLVGTYDRPTSEALLPRIADATGLRDALLADDAGQGVTEPSSSTALEAIIGKLRSAADTEDGNAAALAATDASALAIAQLEAHRDELTLRAGISAEREAIGAQHDRAIRLARLDDAKSTCTTTGASRKNSELSQSYVEKVCQQFEVEAAALGIDRVPVGLLFDRSTRGVSFVKVSIKEVPTAPVAQVLSEGEQRVAAIAGFFADLTESGDTSTLVFDDPVSSLDQVYRVRVAQRLVAEAEVRQVLVFTHDFTFVQYLYEEKRLADKRKRAAGKEPAPDLNYLHIARAAAGAGMPTTAETWRQVSVKERLGRLKVRQQSVAVLYRNGDTEAYEKEARDIVGALRDTWEVFVEEDLLNGVITRHERGVQTQRLAKLSDLSDQDYARVDLGMTVGSRYMTGHAAPANDGSPAQDPAWLLAEITALETFRGEVVARRR
ncbi:MAG: hypothetical protein JWN80_324 [Microbacteriaceae bacterium]|nr:hypothetical protein [Microbacteriaceae bacterium]